MIERIAYDYLRMFKSTINLIVVSNSGDVAIYNINITYNIEDINLFKTIQFGTLLGSK